MKPYQYGLYSGDRLLTEIHSTEPMTDNQVRGVAVSRHRKNPTIGPRRYEAPSEYEDRLRFASVRRFSPK